MTKDINQHYTDTSSPSKEFTTSVDQSTARNNPYGDSLNVGTPVRHGLIPRFKGLAVFDALTKEP